MSRKHISSGSTFEAEIGYSRAIVDGDWVFVSGTTGFDYRTMTISDDVAEQALQCLGNIEQALREAHASLNDVVRVRYILPRAEDFSACWPVLRQHFGQARPAATMICAGLLDPRMKIEIEVTARRHPEETGASGAESQSRRSQTGRAEGGCLCGAIRYRVGGEPLATSICHCTSCRRASGAQSVAWVVVGAADFAFINGQPASFRSSPAVARTFCATCGTSLTYQHDDSPDTLDITTSTFDFPERFAPAREIWLEDRLRWEPLSESLPHFQRTMAADKTGS